VPKELYANRMDDVACPVQTFSLVLRDDRWRTRDSKGREFTAKGRHIFVVYQGRLIVTRRKHNPNSGTTVSHIDLIDGRQVEFAGEILFGGHSFQRGILKEWTNQTGHYHDPERPMDPRLVPQLPLELFRPFVQPQ
jgi:hypothetical protein